MEIISETANLESKELLPQILMRIFSVCKTDPNFPLKSQMISIESEIDELKGKIRKQQKLLDQTISLRDDLSGRLQTMRQENYETKSRLLEELGSDL